MKQSTGSSKILRLATSQKFNRCRDPVKWDCSYAACLTSRIRWRRTWSTCALVAAIRTDTLRREASSSTKKKGQEKNNLTIRLVGRTSGLILPQLSWVQSKRSRSSNLTAKLSWMGKALRRCHHLKVTSISSLHSWHKSKELSLSPEQYVNGPRRTFNRQMHQSCQAWLNQMKCSRVWWRRQTSSKHTRVHPTWTPTFLLKRSMRIRPSLSRSCSVHTRTPMYMGRNWKSTRRRQKPRCKPLRRKRSRVWT